jgi:predicted nucleotidyltransferase
MSHQLPEPEGQVQARDAVRAMEEAVTERLFSDEEALACLCRRHHIRRLALFGSTLKETSRPDSDVDLLVEFESGQEPGLLRLAEIEAGLSALLGGQRVDLRTAEDLSRYFRDEVARMAEVQYAA